MTKRATRWQAEVIDHDGNVLWEILAHDWPEDRLRETLADAGLRVRRASVPKSGSTKYVYSIYDPASSIEAAHEHHDRRKTQLSSVLVLLLDQAGRWVPRDEVRAWGGDSGDRRIRELRARNWPIVTKQLVGGQAWCVKLDLPASVLWDLEKRKKT